MIHDSEKKGQGELRKKSVKKTATLQIKFELFVFLLVLQILWVKLEDVWKRIESREGIDKDDELT